MSRDARAELEQLVQRMTAVAAKRVEEAILGLGPESDEPRRRVPREHQERVLRMMDGWTEPEQILPSDLEHWKEVLEAALGATRTEVPVEVRNLGEDYEPGTSVRREDLGVGLLPPLDHRVDVTR